ncbi:hypothetical protein B0J17DRAFT_454512 [Rhizoctonia solani]|nr:hypothetical protein B0J17DRAFT_454512 [Rhizoctonia solani]
MHHWDVDTPDPADVLTFALLSFQIALWIVLLFNDTYMATFISDGRTRTPVHPSSSGNFGWVNYYNWYLRGWVSFRLRPGYRGTYDQYTPPFFLFVFPALLGLVFSLCLLVITIWAVLQYHHRLSPRQTWKSDTKDILLSIIHPGTSFPTISFIGNARAAPIAMKR